MIKKLFGAKLALFIAAIVSLFLQISLINTEIGYGVFPHVFYIRTIMAVLCMFILGALAFALELVKKAMLNGFHVSNLVQSIFFDSRIMFSVPSIVVLYQFWDAYQSAEHWQNIGFSDINNNLFAWSGDPFVLLFLPIVFGIALGRVKSPTHS